MANSSLPVTVKLHITLQQIIDLDEKSKFGHCLRRTTVTEFISDWHTQLEIIFRSNSVHQRVAELCEFPQSEIETENILVVARLPNGLVARRLRWVGRFTISCRFVVETRRTIVQ